MKVTVQKTYKSIKLFRLASAAGMAYGGYIAYANPDAIGQGVLYMFLGGAGFVLASAARWWCND
jgi:hypothetical protein